MSVSATSYSPDFRRIATLTVLAIVALMIAMGGPSAPRAAADVEPTGCTDDISLDPSIRSFQEVTGADLGASIQPTSVLYDYVDAVVADVAASESASERVAIVKQTAGTSTLGRDIPYVIIGTPDNIANLDAGRNDAAFWRGVRNGLTDPDEALAAVGERPAFAWLTSNVHGNEPAGGEAALRLIYELVARTDCENLKRLGKLDSFIMPSQNPDGRDQSQRTNAWSFDLNRDWGTLTQVENLLKIRSGIEYPSVVYVDAHQQGGDSYFFPPNEDPVLHEISDAAIDSINDTYGPALQQRFNDQGVKYRNYNAYDLFAPEYGDSAPSLLFGAAGMTYEKGSGGAYGKQVYDHYLALDETLNVTTRDYREILGNWVDQFDEAREQGLAGTLEPNQLVSPIHGPGDVIPGSDPSGSVFGYFYLPDNHSGDSARLIDRMIETGVLAYELAAPVQVDGYRAFGQDGQDGVVLPAGTIWIPSGQALKHWIQGVLGENPFQPFSFCYDVCTFSFSLLRGMSGNGWLTSPMPALAQLDQISGPDYGTSPAASPYYAFKTDSSAGLSMLLELMREGATASRTAEGFTAAGKQFGTGTAIIDGQSVIDQTIDIAALSDEWQTPVSGLSVLPAAAREAVSDPSIALYVGTSSTTNPLSDPPGRCSGGYCAALFLMTNKLGIPASEITLVSSAQLTSSPTYLKDQGFTTIVNPAQTIAAGTGATDLQDFVNTGGRYVSWGANGTTSARNAGITLLNTQSIGGLCCTGSTFSGSYDTTSPAAWGFDNGGFIYRSSNGDPVYNPATLTGAGSIPDASAAVSYSDPLKSFGYTVNATGPGQLPGRPAVVDQPFGSGRAVLLGFDAAFRNWVDYGERMLINGMIYPAAPPAPPRASAAGAVTTAKPIRRSQLPDVKNRPLATRDTGQDLVVQVKRSDAKALRRIVANVGVPRKWAKRAKWVATPGNLAYTARFGRVMDTQDSPLPYVYKVMVRARAQGLTLTALSL